MTKRDIWRIIDLCALYVIIWCLLGGRVDLRLFACLVSIALATEAVRRSCDENGAPMNH